MFLHAPARLRRTVSSLLVLVLLAGLVVVLPAVASPDAPVTLVPSAVAQAPGCDEPSPAGPCPEVDGVAVTATGSFSGPGSTVVLDAVPEASPCDTFTGGDFSPSPCWSSVGLGGYGCTSYDLWEERYVGGSCGSWQIETTTSTGITSSCQGGGDFGTYVYGGPANEPGARWSAYGPSLVSGCRITMTAKSSAPSYGPTWARWSVGTSGWVDWNTDEYSGSGSVYVPVEVEISNKGPVVDACEGVDLGGGANRFTVEAHHPLGYGMSYEWRYGDWEAGEEVVGTGPSLTYTFPDDDPYGYLTVWVTDTDGRTSACSVQDPEPTDRLDVSLDRAGDDPVALDETTEVVLTVAAPASNTHDVTEVTADPLVELPPWLDLVEGELPGGFTLAPGTQRVATLVLEATGVDEGTVTSTWTGTADGDEVTATGSLELASSGTFDGAFFRRDGLGDQVRVDETVPVRLRVENETGQDLTDVALGGIEVVGSGELPGEATVRASTPDDLPGGEPPMELPTELAATGPGSLGFVDLELTGVAEGDVVLRADVGGATPGGVTVDGVVETDVVVVQRDLTVEITFDPPEQVQPESDDPEAEPEPVEMTATLTLTNTSGGPLTDVRIDAFEVSRIFGEQTLHLEQTGGYPVTNGGILLAQEADPPAEPVDMEPGAESVFTADFVARDDGDVEFSVLALGADAADRTVRGFGESTWRLAPEKYLEVTSRVLTPSSGLLPAGSDVVLAGRVVNLSQTAELRVGPLLPQPTGNTGVMSLHYGVGRAPDPRLLQPVPELVLGPGDSEVFEVRVATNASDPRIDLSSGEPTSQPSGGTRATLTFDPWALATEADGTERVVRTDPRTDEDRGVKLADEHREHVVSIDDSIAIPTTDIVMLGFGILKGTLVGVGNAGIALLVGVVDAVKLPYTVLRGTWDYQAKVWDAFTEQEKHEFVAGTRSVFLAAAQKTVELGLQDADDLWDQINEHVYREMTHLAQEWETGDYISTAETYAAAAGEGIGSAVMPIALARLAQTPRAAAALARAQEAINTRMLPILDRARRIQYVEDALPLLRALENGTEITDDVMRTLYGVSPDEVAELQRLAKKYEVLLTVRSRHQSSVRWIKKFGAMLKPEAIKIKSVSEMDVRLGYRDGDLGSVVFRRPEPLRIAGNGADDLTLDAVTQSFVREKGFTPGTSEYKEAVDRVKLRVKEWRKHEQAYKTYDRRRSIPTEFNYEGNAIPDLRSPSSRNRTTGFKLEEVGDDEYVVRLLDPTDGRFKRVTGDIDPIAFTNLDGSPLTPAQHKALVDEMRASPLLRAQHPESATFKGVIQDGTVVVEPGAEFVLGQFKPGEPGMQIGPVGRARVVRLDVERSHWRTPRDYHLHWEGGYVQVGGRQRIAPAPDVRPDFGRDVDVEVPSRIAPRPLELGADGEATYGRCTITVTTSQTAPVILLDETGQAIEAARDGSGTRPSTEAAQCLVEGPPTTLPTAPASSVASTPARAGQAATGTAWAAAGSTTDRVVLADGIGSPDRVAVGDQVLLGAQRPDPTLAVVAAVDGRALWLDRPVDVRVDDVVGVTRGADDTAAAGTFRVAGGDRYATAAAASLAAFPDPGDVDTVFLATGRDFPDALAAAAPAGTAGAPILLAAPTTLPGPTRDELVRLAPSTVVVVGGARAVGESVADEVAAALGDVELVRVAGEDRYATAALLARARYDVGVDTVFVATGATAPDALAGGFAAVRRGSPVLLVGPTSLPTATADALDALAPRRIVVLGGAAAVADEVVAGLARHADVVERVAGADRYATAVAVVRSVLGAGATTPAVHVATGRDFPDALAGGAAAARVGAPLLLVPSTGSVPSDVVAELGRLRARRLVVLGGTSAVGEDVRDQLVAAASRGGG